MKCNKCGKGIRGRYPPPSGLCKVCRAEVAPPRDAEEAREAREEAETLPAVEPKNTIGQPAETHAA